jgi:hypothetical protein
LSTPKDLKHQPEFLQGASNQQYWPYTPQNPKPFILVGHDPRCFRCFRTHWRDATSPRKMKVGSELGSRAAYFRWLRRWSSYWPSTKGLPARGDGGFLELFFFTGNKPENSI